MISKKENLFFKATDGLSIEPIEKLVLIDQIIEKIESLIENGKLNTGDALPGERILAEMLGVSRTSVRQALKALNVMGVLEISPGKRTYINESITKLLLNPFRFMKALHNVNIDEFFDARKILEVDLAKRAAQKATKKDIERIQDFLEKSKSFNDIDTLAVSEFAFHQAIFESAKNRILAAVALSISNAIYIAAKQLKEYIPREDRKTSYKQHCKIFEAIKEKNQVKVEKAVLDHLDSMEEIWKKARENIVNR